MRSLPGRLQVNLTWLFQKPRINYPANSPRSLHGLVEQYRTERLQHLSGMF